MRTRLISAALLVPLVAAAAWLGETTWALLVALAALLAAREGLVLIRAIGRDPTWQLSLVLAPALVLTGLQSGWDLYRLAVAVAVVWALVAQIGRSAEERSTDDLASTLAWPIYVGTLMSFAVLLRGLPDGLAWTALLLAFVWANDSFAYLAGRAFGRTGFFSSISPRKTLEGAIAGGIATVAVGAATPAAIRLASSSLDLGADAAGTLASASPWALAGLGLLIAILAPLGDLSKSFVKREAGVKDAGAIIPGHGGVLDRMDSLMFAAPIVYYAAQLTVASY